MIPLNFTTVFVILAILTAIRLAGLHISAVDLFTDEAQYWAWSRELSFGYFSKPPLLAWIIRAFDPICGNGEACVRAASPLLHLATSLVIYGIGKELYDGQVAAWSALAFALGTGVTFSARIISTDVPLIFFWAVALLAYLKLMQKPDWRWTILFGAAIGLGSLAKYAMVYFLLCCACAACVHDGAFRLFTRRQAWLALGIAVLIVVPNVYWNASHEFVTFKHTGDNISGQGIRISISKMLEFLGAQFAVAGPLVFAGFLLVLLRPGWRRISSQDRLMLAFAIPPLALVTAVALVRGAYGNWAAPAVISMTVLVVAWWLRNGRRSFLHATLAIGVFVQAVLITGDAMAYQVSIPFLGRKADLYERTLGWRGLGLRAAELRNAAGAPTVVSEGRADVAALIYYLRNEPVRALSWPAGGSPNHHFDLTHALDDSAAEPVLFVTSCSMASRPRRLFRDVTPLGAFEVASGPTTSRRYYAFGLSGRNRPIEPIGTCTPAH